MRREERGTSRGEIKDEYVDVWLKGSAHVGVTFIRRRRRRGIW